MALVVWLLIRRLPGRAAKVAGVALPVFVVFYGVYEAMVGDGGLFVAIAWWTAISAAIVALAAYLIDRRPLADLQPA